MNIWCAPIQEKCSCGSKNQTYSYGVYVRVRYQRRGQFCQACFPNLCRDIFVRYPPIDNFFVRSGHSLPAWVRMPEKQAA